MTAEWYQRPESFAVPVHWGLSGDEREYVGEATWSLVLAGETDPEEYVSYFEDELDEADVSEDEALAFFEQVLVERRVQQARLGGVPASKLTSAFEELETIGVIAREDYSCCGNCGSTEIWAERDDSRIWRGYVYYHAQDAERIPESRETYVGYGAFLDAFLPEDEWNALSDEEKGSTHARIVTELMMGEVVPILEKHGVGVEWDRDLDTRIRLDDIDRFVAV